jgi:hypothetical protein
MRMDHDYAKIITAFGAGLKDVSRHNGRHISLDGPSKQAGASVI